MTTLPSPEAHLIAAAELDRLAAEARAAPRLRAHLLLHADHAEAVQRLVIAAAPGTYVRPHRHDAQWEMLSALRGRLDLLFFDDHGTLVRRARLDAASPLVTIPSGLWHSAVVAEAGAIVLEVKPGPYRESAFAAWAPPEFTPEAAAFVTWAAEARPLSRAPRAKG